MILYHGSNTDIEKIDLNICHPNKDFGQGFYLTDIQEQAEQMAIRRTRITGEGSPIVSKFNFDEELLSTNKLNIKIFDSPTEEWALFVLNNRNGGSHQFDIVIGPIADDGVAFQLERYMQKIIPLDVLVKELTYRKLNKQYYFGTEKAILELQKI